MTGELFHESGIAIQTTELAAHIGVQHIGIHLGSGEDRFCPDLLDYHSLVRS